MSFTKSGEILRIGRGSYCFLCIHCGCNFFNMKEILDHIEYHFDIIDSAIPNLDANSTDDAMKCNEFIGLPIQQMCKTEMAFGTEDSTEEIAINIEVDEVIESSPLDIKIAESLVSKRKKVKPKVSKQRSTKTEKKSFVTAISITDPRQCLLCESNFKNFAEYQSHLRDTHGMEKIFQCYICGTYHKSLNLLQRHLTTLFHSKISCYQCELNPPITNELVARPHKCFICKEWFGNHMLFRKHFKNIHQQDVAMFFRKKSNCNEFTCYICKKDFVSRNYLTSHMVIHKEVKPYTCDTCGKSYRTRAILGRHLNVHAGITYTCDVCGKSFPYYARLRVHKYSHRTELKHCTVCNKAFKVQRYLARHMKLHRDEKAFACKYCDKRFNFSTGRRAHEISQHNAV